MPFCTMSYDEAKGDLPDVCLRCGVRSVCRVPKTIRLYDTGTYGRGLVGGILMLIDFGRYLGGPTLVLRGPFCAAHRGHWPFRAALVWGLAGLTPVLVLGVLGLRLLDVIGSGAAGGLFMLSTFVCILSATFVYGTSIVKFGADQDNETITLTHVHPKFIEVLERQRDEREQRRAGRRAAGAKADAPAAAPPAAIVRERPASEARGAPFADLDETRERRPRRRPSHRERQNQTALLVSLLVGVPVALFVLVVAVVGIARMVESAAQRRAAAPGGQRPEGPREEERDVETGGRVPGAPRRPPLPADLPGRESVDLVPLMTPRKDVVEGRWLVAGGALHCDRGSFVPRVQFPYRPPEEYDFVVTFWQPELRNGISLVMPKPNGGSFFWFLGNEHGEGYGFHAGPDKGGRIPKLVKAKTVHTTVVRARKRGVSASVDGKELMRLETDFRDLKCDDWRKIHDTRYLAVACDDPTVFYHVRVVEVTGKGRKGR